MVFRGGMPISPQSNLDKSTLKKLIAHTIAYPPIQYCDRSCKFAWLDEKTHLNELYTIKKRFIFGCKNFALHGRSFYRASPKAGEHSHGKVDCAHAAPDAMGPNS